MKADERRLNELIDDPWADDYKDGDGKLLRAGLLLLNWTDRPEGRCHPFVTAAPQAVKYFTKHNRLTPEHRRTLRELAKVSKTDIEWVKTYSQPKY